MSNIKVEEIHKNIRVMNTGIKTAFTSVKKELNEHLDTINQNTNEIQACYEYLAELDSKFEKLNERLDDLEMNIAPTPSYDHISLNLREQEVFLLLYANEEPLTAIDCSRRLGLTVEMIERYLTSMIQKGIPILRNFVEGQVFNSLDLKFKDLQARKNVLKIDQGIGKQLLSEKVI